MLFYSYAQYIPAQLIRLDKNIPTKSTRHIDPESRVGSARLKKSPGCQFHALNQAIKQQKHYRCIWQWKN